uniref:Anti-proliferative protein domain-containing protein n=1 Tax=Melanopsichium pennsylvanicum 4 TaxID=1398559 RepID=A0A077QU21_9BASI|nr:conserved hypothetical protein [Melanopsichium pennsylvanicum 4]
MIYEVAAAVDYILSLIVETPRVSPIPLSALAPFTSTLKDALEKRCQKCWIPSQPEAGSARRSVAWQLHPAGEGADPDILRAFASVVEARAQERHIVDPHQTNVVQLALEWLPVPFTLWIDPGCVAVRTGGGPGATRSSWNFDLKLGSSSTAGIHVVWGQMLANASSHDAVPQLILTNLAPRPIPIVEPTQNRYPSTSISNRRPALHHRISSTSSLASGSSSSSTGLVRSVSLSSTHTVSTDATSLNDDVESVDACPSLCSPSSSLVSSQCTPSSRCESVHDTTMAGDTTLRFAGIRLFGNDHEQDEDAGDDTINASPTMLGLNVTKQTLGAPANIFAPTKPLAASTPVKCNYTTHDNGNVGVLGGGVRLGGAKTCNTSAAQPRHRQHTYLGGANANYSAPMRTVPLPAPQQGYYGYQPTQFHPSQSQHFGLHHHPQAPLPTPYGFAHHQTMLAPRFACQPQQPTGGSLNHDLIMQGEVEEEGEKCARRRLRSRGRRSRGRGAGRAARRQAAAALRALELGSTEELGELDNDDEDDFFSRCSTPASGSECTASRSTFSSCYSSATSSPAKQVSNRSSRNNLKGEMVKMIDFHKQLEYGLARLQAI